MRAWLASMIRYLVRDLLREQSTAILACFCALILMAFMVRAPFTRAQTTESISTFGSDCVTPQSIFNLGDPVCAVAVNSPLADPTVGSGVQRRFEWVLPDGSLFQDIGPDIVTDPQNSSITIPATGPLAKVGTWVVKTVDSSNNGHATARFTVQDPNSANVDLWCPIFAPFEVSAGSSAPFSVFLTNKGPNEAHNVRLVVTVATNSTFQSENQVSGPEGNCTNPAVGGTGSSTCTIDTLPANTTTEFTFVYEVNSNASPGADVSSTATVTSDTNELFATDNTFSASVTIPQNTTPTCVVTCPADITVDKAAGQCSATVTFTATGAGSGCGTVVCTPPSGSPFPLGTTSVICLGDSGGPCVFNVTVQDPQPPTITCPSDITVEESSPGFGLAVVNYPPVLLNDGCPAPLSDCTPPSGSSFPQGTTTVTCQTSSGATTVSCSFTVTVTGSGGGACAVTCPPDKIQSAPPNQCVAVVTYSDPSTTGTCGTVTCNPPSGSTFPAGTTVVSCTASGGPSCSFLITVLPTTPPVITTCASNTAVPVDANCEGVIPNLLPQVVANGCNVVLSQSPAAGSVVPSGNVTVTITAENAAGQATCTAIVRVDNQAPTITCPANKTVEPTCPSGAMVTYTDPVGTDNCPGAVTTRIAGPASASTFPIGTTTITFQVTDAVGNTTTCSFTVTVKTAAAVIQDLISRVQTLQSQGRLSGQQAQGLISKLQAALDAVNNGQTNVACNKLNDFTSQVTAFINNGTLTSAEGSPLITSAGHVKNTFGCTNLGCS